MICIILNTNGKNTRKSYNQYIEQVNIYIICTPDFLTSITITNKTAINSYTSCHTLKCAEPEHFFFFFVIGKSVIPWWTFFCIVKYLSLFIVSLSIHVGARTREDAPSGKPKSTYSISMNWTEPLSVAFLGLGSTRSTL